MTARNLYEYGLIELNKLEAKMLMIWHLFKKK